MSTVISISPRRRYGVARVCRVWGFARAGIYRTRRAAAMPAVPRRRPGPAGPMPDATLLDAIRHVLMDSPFHGEGYRKVWARLRHHGLRTSRERVRRLMRENGPAATTRTGRPRGPRNHDGTIIPEVIDSMWGTDMTAAFTVRISVPPSVLRSRHAASQAPRRYSLPPMTPITFSRSSIVQV